MSDILENALCHHGIQGQKWGERRYQNYDGSLTDEGRCRYGYREIKKIIRKAKQATAEAGYFARESKKEYGAMGRAMQEKFANDYKSKEAELQKLVQDAKERFGNEKIKDLKYKTYYDSQNGPVRYLDASTVTMKDVSSSAIKTMLGTTGFAAMGLPIIWISVPTSKKHNTKAYKQASEDFYKQYATQQYTKN